MELFIYDKKRIKRINEFMQGLLSAESTEEKVRVYRKFEDDIKDMTPLDLFYLHNYSLDTDLTIEEIKDTANKFINVFHKGLEEYSLKFNHKFIHHLNEESQKIEAHLNILKEYYKSQKIKTYKKQLLEGFTKCLEFEKKYIKFENIIFPNLENKLPSTKPFEVLWSLHDDARKQVKALIALLDEKNINEEEIIRRIGKYYYLVFGINQKERLIILPLLEKLSLDSHLDKLFNESLDYGFVFMDTPKAIALKQDVKESDYMFNTNTGSLNSSQLRLILNHIPLDITFVGNDDRVKYFNNRLERHFPRNPSVIGRLVKHCHPPKSIEIVEEIIDDFKSGKRDFAEFWIDINDTFLYITYYAIRDESNHYLGVLEASQDVTRIRSIKGQKRLL